MNRFMLATILLVQSLNFMGCGHSKQGDSKDTGAAMELSATKTIIDFGSVGIGTKKTEQLVLKNLSSTDEARDVGAKSSSSASSFVITNPGHCKLIAPSTQCTIAIEFAPTAQVGNIYELIDVSYVIGGTYKTLQIQLKAHADGSPPPPQPPKNLLDTLLATRPFDDGPISHFPKISNTVAGHTFSIDNTGKLLFHGIGGQLYPVNIDYIDPRWVITDPNPPAAGLPWATYYISSGHTPQSKAIFSNFDGLVKIQREYGIYNLKSTHKECYYAYAKLRLNAPAPYERLYALERTINPRPLLFASDQDWRDFQDELKLAFDDFKGPNSRIVILGTSTTFFSQNPKKGKNATFFETWPQCNVTANNPATTSDAYAFDASGPGTSDLDVHIFIPKLSNICRQAGANGNDGKRDTYWQNTLGDCFYHASAPLGAQNIVDPAKVPIAPGGNANPWKPGSVFYNFMVKWTAKLNNREINFSVHIRPDQKQGAALGAPNNFDNDPYVTKTRFVIPVP
jgi:hypothetical protein